MNNTVERILPDPDATDAFGRRLATLIPEKGLSVALSGPLGAGKSSLARALLRGLGVTGPVPSPTYTLVEPYVVHGREAYHADLYRLGEPDELDMLGLVEIADGAVLLVEWPERDTGHRLRFDLTLHLSHHDNGRGLILEPHTPQGEAVARAALGETA